MTKLPPRQNRATGFSAGEYTSRGDYHKELDPDWSYYRVYVRKMAWVREFVLNAVPRSGLILDVGCGEGVLVEEFADLGYRIFGIDLHYGSSYVHRGDVRHLPYPTATFDVVLCLDVLEHLGVLDQEDVLGDISRIVKPGGLVLFSIPNLAHLESRWSFLRSGRLVRTANIAKHPGDRPIEEHIELILAAGLEVSQRYGVKLTLPGRVRGWLGESLANKIMYSDKPPASLCFLNLLLCRKCG